MPFLSLDRIKFQCYLVNSSESIKFYNVRNAETGLHYDNAQHIATSAKRKLRGKLRRGMSGMIVTHER